MKKTNKTTAIVEQVILGLVIRRLTDAVELLTASFLCMTALITHVLVHRLRISIGYSHAVPVEPVSAKVTADVKPAARRYTNWNTKLHHKLETVLRTGWGMEIRRQQ